MWNKSRNGKRGIKMNCPHCGMKLPDDSDFCQYCGCKIDLPRCARCGTPLQGGEFCPQCGFKNVRETFTDNKETAKTKRKLSLAIIAPWGCTLFLLVLLVFAGIEYVNSKTVIEAQSQEIEQLTVENEEYKTAAEKAKEQYNDEHKKFTEYKSSATTAVSLLNNIKAHKSRFKGYSDFYASTYMVVCGKNESKTINITFTHPYTNIYADSGVWSKDWNGNTTSITFKGLSHEGTQVCTFTNDANSETFCVLIVTVE